MCNNDCDNCPRHICDCRPRILKENQKLKEQLEQAMYLSEGTLRLYADYQNSKYKQALNEIEEYCKQCNLRWDFTAQVILKIINKLKENK